MTRARVLLMPFLLALVAGPVAAQTIREAEVRHLAADQTRALNAGDLEAWLASFAPRAAFTEQALGSDNRIVPYGRATVAEARAQLRKTLAASKLTQTLEVRGVAVSRSGAGAALSARVRTRIESDGRARESCAERVLAVARLGGVLKAVSQTDTLVRCRPAA